MKEVEPSTLRKRRKESAYVTLQKLRGDKSNKTGVPPPPGLTVGEHRLLLCKQRVCLPAPHTNGAAHVLARACMNHPTFSPVSPQSWKDWGPLK